jgi:hypothetical protein
LSPRRSVVLPALAMTCALLASSCGNDQSSAATRPTSTGPPSIKLPSKLLGLTVLPEDISSSLKQKGQQPYVDSVGLFAFREGKDLLQATLEAARFTPQARPESSQFRGSIVSRVGGTSPRVVRMGSQSVFLTSGRNQVVFLWFKKRGFFVLTVRREFPFPRTILRKLLDMHLGL